METFPILLVLCGGKSPVTVPHKGSIMGTFDVFLNEEWFKQSSCRWSETPWRSCDVIVILMKMQLIWVVNYKSRYVTMIEMLRNNSPPRKPCTTRTQQTVVYCIRKRVKICDSFVVSSRSNVTIWWLVSNAIAQKEMVFNSLIIHHLIMTTCISYEMMFAISTKIA